MHRLAFGCSLLAALSLSACDSGGGRIPTRDTGVNPDGARVIPDSGPPPGDCFDGRINGDETDRDCGGSCPGCMDGDDCAEDTDCLSGACTGGVCGEPTCDDGSRNQGETDIDCGGTVCAACSEGRGCQRNDDCESDVCRGGTCAEASCEDGRANGNETDVDCGGGCPGCIAGADCTRGPDCQSMVCIDAVCADPTCEDGFLNGDETDRDCGGPVCRGCRDRQMCGIAADCGSDVCDAGRCVGDGDFIDDFEGGVFDPAWRNASASPWTIETSTPLTGTASARSGRITHSQSTDLEVDVTCGAGAMVSFTYRVSSESCCDDLFFYIDAAERGSWAGTMGPTTVSFPLTAGAHTLRWRYAKDGSVNTGLDAAFIDDVTVTGCAPS